MNTIKLIYGLAFVGILTIAVFAQPSGIGPNVPVSGGGSSTAVINNYFLSNVVNNLNVSNQFNSYNVNVTNNLQVSGHATFNQFITLSNSVQYAEIAWGGPTNNADLNIGRGYYSSFTPIQISGLLNKSTTNEQPFTLVVKNVSGTNWTATIQAGIVDLNYQQQYTVTNGIRYTLEYDPALGITNGVGRVW